jgi:hypothetical protein
MMKTVLFVLLVAACGHKGGTPIANSGSGDGSAVAGPTDTRSEIEKRRDTACKTLGPKVTACAVEDAKTALANGQITKKQFVDITESGVVAKNTSEFIDKCSQSPYSSRQVRVLEVCQKEETECEPLLACLDNLNKQ